MIEYLNYRSVIERANEIGSGIISEKLFNVPQGEKLKMFGIFSKNRAEWVLADIAASLFGFTVIPIYDTLGDENITYVFNHAQLTSCFADDVAVKSLLKCKDMAKVTRLICFDPFSKEEAETFK